MPEENDLNFIQDVVKEFSRSQGVALRSDEKRRLDSLYYPR